MTDQRRKTTNRWFQFSVRAVLTLVLVVASYFAGWRSGQLKCEQAIRDATAKAVADAEAARRKQAAQAAKTQQVFSFFVGVNR